MKFIFKFFYTLEAEVDEAVKLIREVMPKIDDDKWSRSYSSVLKKKVDQDVWAITVSMSVNSFKRFEKEFAADRISILDHSLKHHEKKYKENLRRAQGYLRELKFLLRRHQKYKFLFCSSWADDNGFRFPSDKEMQIQMAKLQRQVRLQNKFIAAIRKLENASSR